MNFVNAQQEHLCNQNGGDDGRDGRLSERKLRGHTLRTGASHTQAQPSATGETYPGGGQLDFRPVRFNLTAVSKTVWAGRVNLHTNTGAGEQRVMSVAPRRVTVHQECQRTSDGSRRILHKKDRLPVGFSPSVKTGYGATEDSRRVPSPIH